MFRFAALSLAALALLAGPASAAVFSGTGTDPAGDGPTPARDVAAIAASYDDAGSATVSLTFGAAPDPSYFFVLTGTRAADGTCGAPFALFGGDTEQADGYWARDGGSAQSGLAVTRAGATVTATVTAAGLAGLAPDCVTGYVTVQGDGDTRYDTLDAPATLTAPAPPPPPPTVTPPAPPPPAAGTPAPTPKPKAIKKAAKLAVTVSGVPRTIKRNRTMSLKVKVANTGTAAATGVRLRAGTARGLSVRPRTISVRTLKAGKATTRRLKVRLSSKARTTTMLSLTATGAKQLKAASRVALRIGTAKKPKPTKPRPTPGPTKPKSPLAGTYWWYTITHVDSAWDNHGVYFLDDVWAYHGIPKGGLPTACGARVAGCTPYTYDPATGAVTLGTAAGTFKDGKLQIADEGDLQDFTRLLIPEAGARYDVNLVHRGFQGMCGLILGCTTWQHWLRLMPDGQFVYSKSTTTTMGDPGMGPFTAVGSYPPDEHGAYAVQPDGRIHLAYADGSTKDYTFAVQLNAAGQPDPGGEGVFLDEDNFYKDEMP